ncbi:3-oxoacyl-[acyl-carrier-protein] synthase 2 [Streptomyces sulfonofaciens]|uniref:3-oxoacyl-[acyl-carrier-protein] synthase 2 n=1 Tax=Streptomyces sulfonofaciens TaxID=68272 RepID=A0A919G3I0_9ACTN|nr:beta-ketoacyl-[acyl-carrier-protein] synthase family protein [Streptomyces sulfonofaciens]GHH76848.1 3-oxoacyl-[acyl-carrier-protein] synthase 2 [Streptomyces sulfonofaciens]
MSEHRQVVVTGLGVRSAAGGTPDAVWRTLLAPRPTAAWRAFDEQGAVVDAACEVPGFDPAGYLTPKQTARADRSAQLAFCAATDAVRDAGGLAAAPARRAVVTGTARGGVSTLEDGLGRPNALFMPQMMHNAAAFWIASEHGVAGPGLTLSTACASGAHAVGEGMQMIRAGSADVVVAGGHDASLTLTTLLAFRRARALATGFDDPAAASRPFDAQRRGFVLAEGAAFVVLERAEAARARGARVYAALTGYGRTCDTHHLTAPHPDGAGARACMDMALADARVAARDIAHVNAHGTGTELNDLAEARAISALFGPGAVPVTASKAVTGHALGAAGALEAVIAVLCVAEGLAPPTANLARLDPRCTLDVITGEPRKLAAGPVVTNSFGFGGHNACLVLDTAGP